ncbi:hypothetical protein [Anaerospora sp.]|uniref:hypothetical protein n=1 Tax=Anaerospora sp. TaxID=1960278 RepID=UPI00289C590C|nr:hypothetical protein [Anaerospora sp.]
MSRRNQMIVMAALLIILASLLNGCASKAPSPIQDTAKQEQAIMEKFTKMIEDQNSTAAQVVQYIDANHSAVSKENAVVMASGLEQKQKAGLPDIEKRFADDEALQAALARAHQKSGSTDYTNAVEDTAVKERLAAAKNSGYKIETAEGMYYPVIDYEMYKKYQSNLTPDFAAYIDIMAVESQQPPAKDAALRISWDELIKRTLAQERYLAQYPDSPKTTEIKMLLNKYAMFALYGTNNTPLFDYDTKQMAAEAKKGYLETAWDDKNGVFSKTMRQYVTVLKKNDESLTRQVREFQNQSSQEITMAMNRYYVAGFDDAAQFEAVFTRLQGLVAVGNKESVADYILYPLNVYSQGVPTTYTSREELLKSYDTVFTAIVKEALAKQKVNETFVNYKGVMAGSGEIWFTQSDDLKYRYGILAINK